MFRFLFISLFVLIIQGCQSVKDPILTLNDLGYFEMPGLNIMAFSDFYPEGHQGGFSDTNYRMLE